MTSNSNSRALLIEIPVQITTTKDVPVHLPRQSPLESEAILYVNLKSGDRHCSSSSIKTKTPREQQRRLEAERSLFSSFEQCGYTTARKGAAKRRLQDLTRSFGTEGISGLVMFCVAEWVPRCTVMVPPPAEICGGSSVCGTTTLPFRI